MVSVADVVANVLIRCLLLLVIVIVLINIAFIIVFVVVVAAVAVVGAVACSPLSYVVFLRVGPSQLRPLLMRSLRFFGTGVRRKLSESNTGARPIPESAPVGRGMAAWARRFCPDVPLLINPSCIGKEGLGRKIEMG